MSSYNLGYLPPEVISSHLWILNLQHAWLWWKLVVPLMIDTSLKLLPYFKVLIQQKTGFFIFLSILSRRSWGWRVVHFEIYTFGVSAPIAAYRLGIWTICFQGEMRKTQLLRDENLIGGGRWCVPVVTGLAGDYRIIDTVWDGRSRLYYLEIGTQYTINLCITNAIPWISNPRRKKLAPSSNASFRAHGIIHFNLGLKILNVLGQTNIF